MRGTDAPLDSKQQHIQEVQDAPTLGDLRGRRKALLQRRSAKSSGPSAAKEESATNEVKAPGGNEAPVSNHFDDIAQDHARSLTASVKTTFNEYGASDDKLLLGRLKTQFNTAKARGGRAQLLTGGHTTSLRPSPPATPERQRLSYASDNEKPVCIKEQGTSNGMGSNILRRSLVRRHSKHNKDELVKSSNEEGSTQHLLPTEDDASSRVSNGKTSCKSKFEGKEEAKAPTSDVSEIDQAHSAGVSITPDLVKVDAIRREIIARNNTKTPSTAAKRLFIKATKRQSNTQSTSDRDKHSREAKPSHGKASGYINIDTIAEAPRALEGIETKPTESNESCETVSELVVNEGVGENESNIINQESATLTLESVDTILELSLPTELVESSSIPPNVLFGESGDVQIISEPANANGEDVVDKSNELEAVHFTATVDSQMTPPESLYGVFEGRSFDFSSIHDDPELAAEVKIDPSWDIHKVHFSEFQGPRSASVAESSNMFEVAIDLGRSPETEEEKKDKESSFDGGEEGQPPLGLADVDELDPLGWPRLSEGLQEDHLVNQSCLIPSDAVEADGDEYNLLSDPLRSEAGVGGTLGEFSDATGALLPNETRITEYSKTEVDEASLGDQSNSDSSDNVESSDNETDDVDYALANDDEADEDEELGTAVDDIGNSFAALDTKPIQFFSISQSDSPEHTTASTKDNVPERRPELSEASIIVLGEVIVMTEEPDENSSSIQEDCSGVDETVECPKIDTSTAHPVTIPPPPPPPADMRRKKKRNKEKADQTSIPLVALPSVEKLQKWGLNQNFQRMAMDNGQIVPDDVPAAPSNRSECVQMSVSVEKNIESSSLQYCSEATQEDADLNAQASSTILSKMGQESLMKTESEPSISLAPSNSNGKSATGLVGLFNEAVESQNTSSPALRKDKMWEVPLITPCPFDVAVGYDPSIISDILSWLGDPVAICRMKMTCKSVHEYIVIHEHMLMRDAVRIGGLQRSVRPYFWLWVTLEKSSDDPPVRGPSAVEMEKSTDLIELERMGNGAGKWHSVIERDVSRSFGNLPPHKSAARLRTDSIVRALVTWGRSRLVKKGVRGSGEPPAVTSCNSVDQDEGISHTDTVSDWSGVTPVGSFASSQSVSEMDRERTSSKRNRRVIEPSELALNGNLLTDEMKKTLQDKLSFILHALAAVHSDVGYCQGEDYVIQFLLRILQDTIRWKALNGTLPLCIVSAERQFAKDALHAGALSDAYVNIDQSLIVEETCFRVMNILFTSYGLRHFYWPELRCLKTSCLVFERLIQAKLPVLADHFEHHELNVGLFALGWFQTMFLYLPSMPSATVCHIWDIWLVERSFKIFFRVGCAILFLSQPTLLNHELEGMMCYLNTFPDATLLRPDILIPCALQIKVTNRMLMAIETEVANASY
jgi:hypothetical protein